jgi:hypothetical protein
MSVFGDVGRDPVRFVAREQLRRRSPAGLLLEIDECQFLPARAAGSGVRVRV